MAPTVKARTVTNPGFRGQVVTVVSSRVPSSFLAAPRIDPGPVVLMIENYRTRLIWKLRRRCPHVVRGLRRAGFTGGWL